MARGEGGSPRRAVAPAVLLVLCSCIHNVSSDVGIEGMKAIVGDSARASPEMSMPAPSTSLAFVEQLASVISSVAPTVGQFLFSSGDGSSGSSDFSGGGGTLATLSDFGRKAAGAFSTTLASNNGREAVWVPLHEHLGLLRDFLGLSGDDKRGVRNAAYLLLASQLPLLQFAVERDACKDPEDDRKALNVVTNYPPTKKMLEAYMEQRPDKNLQGAPADLVELYSDFREHLKALRGAGGGQVLPVSIVGGLDSLSRNTAELVNGYLATVARYLTYGDRFQKNKRGLLFFTRHVLPRVLQLFALQLDACRYVWNFLEEVFPGGMYAPVSTSLSELPSYPARPLVFDEEDGGTLRLMAQNLGFSPPQAPYAHARALVRRILARVQLQLSSLYALSRGCLAGTSLSFQREYAEAQNRIELGEVPASAFLILKEKSEQPKAIQAADQTPEATAEKKEKANPRLRALKRNAPRSDPKVEEKNASQSAANEVSSGIGAPVVPAESGGGVSEGQHLQCRGGCWPSWITTLQASIDILTYEAKIEWGMLGWKGKRGDIDQLLWAQPGCGTEQGKSVAHGRSPQAPAQNY
ncbi:uncharacterized protein LOC34622381, partial [Cyclospora cayetanensis]|uniref:Uncharacterized protein LOC34622381 n=1 Tax=Cyclospora cayetanensis TaxID=88456 RepID=A0A6P6RZZ8_9EIME